MSTDIDLNVNMIESVHVCRVSFWHLEKQNKLHVLVSGDHPPEQTTSLQTTRRKVGVISINRQQATIDANPKTHSMSSRHKDTSTGNAMFYAKIGNIVNSAVLGGAIAYAAVVVYYSRPGATGVLDPQWKEDGFCIQNKEVDYLSSFDTCLYVDVIFSAVLGALYFKWKDLPGMEISSKIVPMVILSTLGHGFAHGKMAAEGRSDGWEHEGIREIPPWPHLIAFIALFWLPLLKASMPRVNTFLVAIAAFLATYLPILAGGLKKELNFAWIQTVVSIAFHCSELSLPPGEKNRREYMTLPLAGLLPVLVAWNEALFCSAYFKRVGGHVWYDFSIVASFILQYIDSYLYRSKLATKEKKM